MWVFFQTLDPRYPKWKLEESIIGTNPGLGFRPLPPADNVESTLIWYTGSKYDQYKHWTNSLDDFLAGKIWSFANPHLFLIQNLLVYKTPGLTPGRGANIIDCNYEKPPPPGRVCDVTIGSWAPCTQENNYNYHRSAPCVFLKLNKIFGWKPDLYNSTEGLPDAMPKELVETIKKTSVNAPNEVKEFWVFSLFIF